MRAVKKHFCPKILVEHLHKPQILEKKTVKTFKLHIKINKASYFTVHLLDLQVKFSVFWGYRKRQ